ncbi:MAG: TetR/AcrR family transcriptional regulator [Luteibacter sp.]
MSQADTRETILSVARKMVQAHGYAALSFRDIAAAVGIKSASVHYHFPTKGALGAELARRYTQEMADYLASLIDEGVELPVFVKRYTEVFRGALENGNRMCMCGVLAAERDELPAEVQKEVARFSEVNIAWLARALNRGGAKATKATEARALAIYSAVEGAQLVSRGFNDIALYDRAIAAYRSSGLLP